MIRLVLISTEKSTPAIAAALGGESPGGKGDCGGAILLFEISYAAQGVSWRGVCVPRRSLAAAFLGGMTYFCFDNDYLARRPDLRYLAG
jgi:hypothetical protein